MPRGASPTAHLSDEDALSLLSQWLAIPSITGHEAAYLEAIEATLEALGWAAQRQPVAPDRWNLWARPSESSAPLAVLFCTHVDTVPPFTPVRREGERLYGRGAVDTKGVLVAMLAAAQRLRGRRDDAGGLGFLLVVGEEVDHCGAKAAARLGLRVPHIILGEPTCCRLVTHQKGAIKVRLEVSGTAAHSAYPERGRSALEPMLDVLQALRAAPWPHDPHLGPTTMNIGELHAGVAANVVPAHAQAELVFRVVGPCADVIADLGRIAAGVEVHVTAADEPQTLYVPPAPGDAEGSTPWSTTVVPFNTDAAFLQGMGRVTLVGPGDIERAHAPDECITDAELKAGVELYERLGDQLLSASGE